MTTNLYDILNIKQNASNSEIKIAYKQMALKYHPDKNPSDNGETFKKLQIANEILSDPVKRAQYDSMNNDDKEQFIIVIKNFIESLINEDNIKALMNMLSQTTATVTDVKDYNKFKQLFDNNFENKSNFDYINNFVNEFMHNKTVDEKVTDIDMSIFEDSINNLDVQKREYKFINSSDCSNYTCNTTFNNTATSDMNIHGEIKTTLEEIYKGMIKEITVNRQIITDTDTKFKKLTYKIPLNNDRVTLEKQGDDYLLSEGKGTGDLVIDIKCKQHKYFKRVNDYDILVSLPMTLYELFNGFSKTFNYFNDTKITLVMKKGFDKITANKQITKQNKFDGDKITLVMPKLGIFNDHGERENLIICLLLIKDDKFNQKLKERFN